MKLILILMTMMVAANVYLYSQIEGLVVESDINPFLSNLKVVNDDGTGLQETYNPQW